MKKTDECRRCGCSHNVVKEYPKGSETSRCAVCHRRHGTLDAIVGGKPMVVMLRSENDVGEDPFDIPFLHPEQVAVILNRGQQTLANWRAQNKGPRYERVAGRIIYPLEAFWEWVEETDTPVTVEKPNV